MLETEESLLGGPYMRAPDFWTPKCVTSCFYGPPPPAKAVADGCQPRFAGRSIYLRSSQS